MEVDIDDVDVCELATYLVGGIEGRIVALESLAELPESEFSLEGSELLLESLLVDYLFASLLVSLAV